MQEKRMLEVEDLGDLVDTSLVLNGCICARGLTKREQEFAGGYTFLRQAYPNNKFSGEVHVPIIHFLEVHDGNPVRIASDDSGRIVVCPEEAYQEENFLNRAYPNSEEFDLVSFMRLPYLVGEDVVWERISLPKEGCLLYFEEGGSIDPQDSLEVSQIEQSEIVLSFHKWFTENESFWVEMPNGAMGDKKFPELGKKELSSVLTKGANRLIRHYVLDY